MIGMNGVAPPMEYLARLHGALLPNLQLLHKAT